MPSQKSILAWLLPPWMFLAVLLGAAIVRGRPTAALGVVLGLMLLVPIAWVTLSALWPASADRRCPECGEDSLERVDPRTTVGLRCKGCGWRDEAASAWLIAEEEGPLEEIVLHERGRRGPARKKPDRSVVDTSSRPD